MHLPKGDISEKGNEAARPQVPPPPGRNSTQGASRAGVSGGTLSGQYAGGPWLHQALLRPLPPWSTRVSQGGAPLPCPIRPLVHPHLSPCQHRQRLSRATGPGRAPWFLPPWGAFAPQGTRHVLVLCRTRAESLPQSCPRGSGSLMGDTWPLESGRHLAGKVPACCQLDSVLPRLPQVETEAAALDGILHAGWGREEERGRSPLGPSALGRDFVPTRVPPHGWGLPLS